MTGAQTQAPPDLQARVSRLTAAQRECLRLVHQHYNSKQQARLLGLSPHTVDDRLKEAIRILGVASRFEAARLLAAAEGAALGEGERHPPPDRETSTSTPAGAYPKGAPPTDPNVWGGQPGGLAPRAEVGKLGRATRGWGDVYGSDEAGYGRDPGAAQLDLGRDGDGDAFVGGERHVEGDGEPLGRGGARQGALPAGHRAASGDRDDLRRHRGPVLSLAAPDHTLGLAGTWVAVLATAAGVAVLSALGAWATFEALDVLQGVAHRLGHV